MVLKSTSFLLIAAAVGAAQNPGPNEVRISLTGKPWSVSVDATGLTTNINETQPDGRRYFEAANSSTGVALSVTLEQIGGPADLAGCREVFRNRLQSLAEMHPSDEKQGQQGQMATQEFMVREFNGAPVQQKNMYLCLVKENVFADIHLSKVSYAVKDEPLLNAILNSVHFVEGNSPAPTSWDLFLAGTKSYDSGNFTAAIGPYQRAFDIEKQERRLDASFWRVLLENPAMSYGVTGKLDAAEEIMRYGLTKDPEYPMFYFILADTYAERGDLDNTIKFLTIAFEYRKNVIPGEKMPDPRKDDSLQRFLKNDRFRKFLDTLPK